MTNETERKTLEQPEQATEQPEKREPVQIGETDQPQTGEKTPEQAKNTAGKKGVKKRSGTKSVLFPILLTALLLGAFYTARIVYFCTQYPQKTPTMGQSSTRSRRGRPSRLIWKTEGQSGASVSGSGICPEKTAGPTSRSSGLAAAWNADLSSWRRAAMRLILMM